ncbi:hypothetical protein J3R83DRAFT_2477 [Lanmaoa asiatica]|nr:hypothetical protein J3R83DRAFT_2477 [Lanmaoa asiatica]
MEDINEAIVLCRDALALRSPGHPERPTSLSNTACVWYKRSMVSRIGNSRSSPTFAAALRHRMFFEG